MSTERIALTQPIETRDGTLTKDSRSTNCVFETRDQKREFIKRPGLVYETQLVAVTPPAYKLNQGLTSFNSKLIGVVADSGGASSTVYSYNPLTSVQTAIGSLSTSQSFVYFTKTPLDANLFFHNKVSGYLYTSGGVFSSPATLPPGPYVAGTAFLDAFVFIGTANNRIYNSAYQDPSTWDALSYIAFEQTTDTLVAITKHLNYIVAFGKASTQFFYDNGTYTSTTTPLAVAQSYTTEIGCAQGDSVVSTNNTVVWMGYSKTNGRSIYVMDGVSPIKVSNHSIDKIIDKDSLSKVSSFAYKFAGHTLYVLTLHESLVTIVYDLDEKMWYQWTQYSIMSNDQPNPGTYQESYFRPAFYAQVNNISYVLDDDTATVYHFDKNSYQDNSQSIYCRTVTDIGDNGTTKRKFYGRLEIVGDKVSGIMQVRHSGDDYNTWSSYRSIDLSASRSQVYLSGADRRRAWEFLVTSNVPLRLDGAEIDFRLGELDQEQNVGGGNYRR
jgi:hypothetical protein